MSEVIKLKAVAVNVADGTRSDIRLTTTRIYSNSKQYQSDEFHVNVVFDISEFAKSAKEKLLHAQLEIDKKELVDQDGTEFTVIRPLEMRGFPIYVFEETDVAQVVKDEGDAVQEAVEAE